MLIRWPGKVPADLRSAQLTSLTDVMATMADMLDVQLPANCAEDSFSMLPAWLDENHPQIRPHLLTQAFAGAKTLAIRRGNWKYIDHPGSGGNRYDNNPELKPFDLPDSAPNAPAQLYDLSADPGETDNLYDKNPELAKELKSLLEQTKSAGRSKF